MNVFFSGAQVGYEKVHGKRGGKSRAWREAQLARFNQFRSLSELAQAFKLSVTLVESSSLLQFVKVRMSGKVPNYADERTASELRITEMIKAVLFKVWNIWGEYITPKFWMELQSKKFLVQTNNKGRAETKFYFVS